MYFCFLIFLFLIQKKVSWKSESLSESKAVKWLKIEYNAECDHCLQMSLKSH